MFRYSLIVVAGLAAAAPVSAGSWADGLFEELSKDFGTVPHGPSVSHSFRFTNKTDKPLHISGVRVSCGCTSASASKTDLEPGESASIQAEMDTRRFLGTKNVKIYVTFDQPQWQQVQLWVQANSRSDISVSPEAFQLGRVHRGSTPSGTITITFSGSSQASISEVERESNYIQAKFKETRREGSEVSYELTASIRADAPVGRWYSDLWLKTNNPGMPRIRVPLTVEIESALSLSPSDVNLGQIKPGAQAERKIIVRGVKPFKITKVQGTDKQLDAKDSATDSKPVHVLTLTLKPTQAGDFTRKLKVVTDLKEDNEIEFEAKAQVVK